MPSRPASDGPLDIAVLSSTEHLSIAMAVQSELRKHGLKADRWDQGAFAPGGNVLESVKRLLLRSRGAVLVMTPDHDIMLRGKEVLAPRDNLVFEFGLSVGLLGDERTFVLLPADADKEFRLPTDTGGVNFLVYKNSDLEGSLSDASQAIASALRKETRMSVATWYDALQTLTSKVNTGAAHGGFESPDLVVGVNPGGAIIGGMLFFVGNRFFKKPQFIAFSPEVECTEEMQAVLRSLVDRSGRKKPRVLVVDASMKRGDSMRGVVSLIHEALGEANVEVRTAVLIDLPEYREKADESRADYVVTESYRGFMYGPA